MAALLLGCSHFDYTLARRTEIDTKIAAARTETESRLKLLNDQQLGLLQQSIATHEARAQAAADYLFKGSVVGSMLKTPTRPEQVMTQSINQTSAQLPPATPAAQAAAFKALQTELDEAKVTTEQLKAQYEKELGVARAEGAAKAQALEETTVKLRQIDAQRVEVLTKANQTEQALQAVKDKVQDAALADKMREAANAKSVQAIKIRFSTITGILALLCAAGAVYLPVFRGKMAGAAAVFAVATGAIWFVEAWMIAVGVGVGIAALAGWAVRNHYIESKAASNVYRAIQSIKDTAKDDYNRVVKPQLDEWMTKYDTKGNKVPDAAAIAHVDKVLMATEAK